MTGDPEAEERQRQQTRAIDVFRPSGALMNSQYNSREQNIVPITEFELEYIGLRSWVESTLQQIGLFFASGSLWLGVEQYLTMGFSGPNNLLFVCLCCLIFGLILWFIGTIVGWERKNKIKNLIKNSSNSRI